MNVVPEVPELKDFSWGDGDEVSREMFHMRLSADQKARSL